MIWDASAVRIAHVLRYGVLVAGAILLLKYLQWPANYELAWYDVMVRLRLASHWQEQPVIVFALLDGDRIKPPIDDETLARVLRRLCDAKPRAIGIDLLRDKPVGPGHDTLNDVLTACPPIVGVSLFGRHQDQYVSAPEALRPGSRYGFADIMVDPDGVVRRGFVALDRGRSGGNEQAEFSLALRLARLYLAGESPPIRIVSTRLTNDPHSGVRTGPTHLPRLRSYDGGYVAEQDGGYQFLIDYKEPLRSVDLVRVSAVLDSSFNAETVRGRIVLIGNMTAEAKDHFPTPIGRGRSDEDRTPGVFLHALMANQLIRYGLAETRPMRFFPEWAEVLLILISCLDGAIAGLIRRRYLPAVCAAFVVMVLLISYLSFCGGWWFPPIACAVGFVPAAIIGNIRQRVRARVFLSYAREDEKRVRRMQQRLEKNGFEAWMDRNIEPGQRWAGAIRQALHDADCFVVCVTSRSVSKEGVLHQELKEALDIWKGRLDEQFRIVPARLENVPLPKELEEFQWLDLWSEKDWDKFVRALCQRHGRTRQ